MDSSPAMSSGRGEPAPHGESSSASGFVRRLVFAVTPLAMLGVISVATGLSVKAHNLTNTQPNSDGDMFGFGSAAVVLAAIVLGFPVLIYAIMTVWQQVRATNPPPVDIRPLLALTGWTVLVNLAVAAVSWLMVSDATMYRPDSIERAQDAVLTAGLRGTAAVAVVGALAASVVRTARHGNEN